jgi:hypothetical protein
MLAQSKKFIGKRQVAVRYGNRAVRTIERWVATRVLPPPDQVINSRWYWTEETLDAHDRQRTIASADQREARADKSFKQRVLAAAPKKGAGSDIG